jgi:hypothetical protein
MQRSRWIKQKSGRGDRHCSIPNNSVFQLIGPAAHFPPASRFKLQIPAVDVQMGSLDKQVNSEWL